MQVDNSNKTTNNAAAMVAKQAQRMRALFRFKDKATVERSDSSTSVELSPSQSEDSFAQQPSPKPTPKPAPAAAPAAPANFWAAPPLVRDVCVFAGPADTADARCLAAADSLGADLARAHLNLLFDGSSEGLMGRVALACLQGGGHATGVYAGKPPPWVVDPLMHQRFRAAAASDVETSKKVMVRAADAVVVLPGGWETLDNYAFIMNRSHGDQKVVFVNIDGYFEPLRAFAKTMRKAGFTRGAPLPVLRDTPREALAYVLGPEGAKRLGKSNG